MKGKGQEAGFALLRLTYNGGDSFPMSENVLKCEGGGANLDQKLELPGTEVQAKFEAEKNQTEIRVKTHGGHQHVTRL